MNLIVYVSDALRTDHVGCYGARCVSTRTIDELAAGGVRFDQAISAGAVDVPVDRVDDHRPVPAPSRLPALGRDARPGRARRCSPWPPRTATRPAASCSTRTTSSRASPTRTSSGRARRSTAPSPGCASAADRPFCLWFHSWATHMPYDVLHAERKEWLAAKEEIIDGIQSDSASGLEALREAYRARRSSAPRRCVLAAFLERARRARPARADRVRVRLRPRRVVGRAVRREGRREGHLPHARRRRSTTRSPRCR